MVDPLKGLSGGLAPPSAHLHNLTPTPDLSNPDEGDQEGSTTVIYTTPYHWLEAYLTSHTNLYCLPRSSPASAYEKDIWQTVSDVLRTLDCEALGFRSSVGTFSSPSNRGRGRGNKSIVPLELPWKEGEVKQREIRREVVLGRVKRELGLEYTFEEVGEWSKDHERKLARLRGASP